MIRRLFTRGYRANRVERYLRHKGRQLFNILTPWMWLARRRDRQTRMINEAVFEKLASHDPAAVRQAVNEVNDFTRKRMREDGFLKQILPQIPISNEELDRVGWTAKPAKVAVAGGDTEKLPIVTPDGTMVDTLPLSGYIRRRGITPIEKRLLMMIRETHEERDAREEREGLDPIDE